MTENSVNSKLTAILYADIAGYSRLTRQDERNGLLVRAQPTVAGADSAATSGA